MSQIRDRVTTFIAVPSNRHLLYNGGMLHLCFDHSTHNLLEYFIDVIETHGYGMRFKLMIVSIHVV